MNWRRVAPLALGGLALLAVAAGCGSSRSSETRTYQVTGAAGRLVVEDSTGQVDITVGDGPVRVTETVRYNRQRPKTSHTSANGTVHLTGGSCWGVFGWGCEVDFKVRVPAGTAVEVHADAGKVTVTGLAGDLDVKAGAGEVQASDLSSAHVRIRAQAGDVSLRYRSAPSTVDARANAGSIGIWVPGGTSYAVDTSTDAGNRTVAVPMDSASAHHIKAHTDAGSVRIRQA
jgi:hypothetical protein